MITGNIKNELEIVIKQSIIERFSDQMIKPDNYHGFNYHKSNVPGKWKILSPDGEFHTYDGLTWLEAEIVWREMWGLNFSQV